MVPDTSQAIQATLDRASVTAIVTPRGPGEPGPGWASETLTMTAIRPKARTTSMIRATLTTRSPVTESDRVANPNMSINVTRQEARRSGRAG